MVSYYGDFSAAGAFGNPGDGPGSASPFSDHFDQMPSDGLLAYMESHHRGSWHTTLNNHASTRPKRFGGPTVESVTACKTFTSTDSASASWKCVLKLPNSFTKGDGIQLCVSSEAPTRNEADEHACRLAFTHLLMRRPSDVVLRPPHWDVSIVDLLENMPTSLPAHQALPVHVNVKHARMVGESAVERFADPADVWEGRVVKLLRYILTCYGGSFNPARISPNFYEDLNRLLKPKELKPFVEQHPEFAWHPIDKKGMIITWKEPQ